MPTLNVHIPLWLPWGPDEVLFSALNMSSTPVNVIGLWAINLNSQQNQATVNWRTILTVSRHTDCNGTLEGVHRISDNAPEATFGLRVCPGIGLTGTPTTFQRYCWGWEQIEVGGAWDWGKFARLGKWGEIFSFRGGTSQPLMLQQQQGLVVRSTVAGGIVVTDRIFPTAFRMEITGALPNAPVAPSFQLGI